MIVYDEGLGLWLRDDAKDREVVKEVRTAYRHLPIRPGDVVLDLGGHIGSASRAFVERGAGRVYAIEPDAANAEVFLRNAEGFPITLVVAAVAPVAGLATLYLNATGCYSYHRTVLGTKRRVAVTVPAVTLGSLLETWRPDVVKCDIEFAEHDLAELRVLPEYVRALQIEVHFRYGNAESQARLHASGEALLDSFRSQGFRAIVPPKVGPNVWRTNSTWERT